MKTYLAVLYAEKDQAKALGARWDMARKQWYCPDGVDLNALVKWLPGVPSYEQIVEKSGKKNSKRKPKNKPEVSKGVTTYPNHSYPLWSRTDIAPWDDSLGEFSYT